jgi:hypothetical protein
MTPKTTVIMTEYLFVLKENVSVSEQFMCSCRVKKTVFSVDL